MQTQEFAPENTNSDKLSKHSLRKRLLSLGKPLPTSATKRLLTRAMYNECRVHAYKPESILWNILIYSDDGFWRHFHDLRVIGIMAQVCRAFRFTIPERTDTWRAIAKNAGRATKRHLQEVFLISPVTLQACPFFALKRSDGTEAHLVKVTEGLQLAMLQHGNAAKMHAHRRVTTTRRINKNVELRRVRWHKPFHVLTLHEQELELATAAHLNNLKKKKRKSKHSVEKEQNRARTQEDKLEHFVQRELQYQLWVRSRHRRAPPLSEQDINNIRERVTNDRQNKKLIASMRRLIIKGRKFRRS